MNDLALIFNRVPFVIHYPTHTTVSLGLGIVCSCDIFYQLIPFGFNSYTPLQLKHPFPLALVLVLILVASICSIRVLLQAPP